MLMSQFPLALLRTQGGTSTLMAKLNYSRADWNGLRHYLRDVPREYIFILDAFAATPECFECFQFGIDLYIPHRKYQVKPHHLHSFACLCYCHSSFATNR